MKKFFFVGAFGVFLFIYIFSVFSAKAAMMVEEDVCATSLARGKVLINEISSASAYNDWAELYNLFDQCIDLSNFSIWDSSESIKTFSSSTFLIPGEYLNVDLNNRLNKAGDSVVLKYSDEEWDRFDYGAGAEHAAAEEGYVWARIPDGGASWVLTTTTTPGDTNGDVVLPPVEAPTTTVTTTPDPNPIIPTSTTSTAFVSSTTDYSGLRLNEIFPDPETGNEWVEIFNLGTTTLSVEGIKVCDNRLTSCKTTTGTIANSSWFVFDLGSGFLNNSGDSAILKDNQENILDRVDFGTVGKGRSYARSIDGAGSWQITTQVTAGARNVIVAPPVSSGGSGGSSYTAKSVAATTTTVAVSSSATSTFFGKVILNEILPDPEGVDTADEFVEIKNIFNTEINLAGWAIGDKDKKYSLSGMISANGLLFWRRAITGIVLNNTQAEEVFLYDTNGNIVDRIKYERAESGLSYARFTDGWKWTNQITAGQENILEEEDSVGIVWKLKYPLSADLNEVVLLSADESVDPRGGKLSFEWNFGDGEKYFGEEVEKSFVSSGVYVVDVVASSTVGTVGKKQIKINVGSGLSLINSPILISEVMSDPAGQDSNEYIEIWNSGSSTIDLSGWQLRVGTKKYQIPDKTNITPKSCLVFYKAATKISLNNAGGKIELLAPGDSVVDVVKFGKSVSGKSYSLVSGEWLLSIPTPGVVLGAETIKGVGIKITSNATKSVGGVWHKPLSIYEAREQEKGVGVLIVGAVTVLPGVFGVQYFYIADDTAGIAIYQYKKDFPPLKVGDVVRVRGVISEANGQKRVNIKKAGDVDILKTEQVISAVISDLSDLEDQPLGVLVKIVGDITEKKSGYWYVDDDLSEAVVYFKKGTKVNLVDFLEGQKVEVSGVLEQGKNGLQIWPRGQEDIKIVGMAKELEKPVVKEGVGTYFSAAAGAATTLFLGFLARARGVVFLAWFGRGVKAVATIIRRG